MAYIEREALLAVVGKMPLDWEYGKAVSDIYDIIKDAPAADVAPVVHGRWNIVRWNSDSRDYKSKVVEVECSECGGVFELPMILFGLCYNYCPNCGARMDGE